MSTAKAAPRKLKVGDKVIFMLKDNLGNLRGVPRNVWLKGEVDYFYQTGQICIKFYHKGLSTTLIKYVHTNSIFGDVVVIRKVA